MIKIRVNEQQLNTLQEMAYPSTWDINFFKKLTSYKSRVEYCKTHLEYLKSGSSRSVFRVDDNKVLKLAKNKKGVDQNNSESEPLYRDYICFAKIFDVDTEDMWIEMELATPSKKSDFKRVMGFDFNFLRKFIAFAVDSYISPHQKRSNIYYDSSLEDSFMDIINDYDNEWLCDLYTYLNNYQLNTYGDLLKPSSYGVVNRNGNETIVIIDYGLYDGYFD